MTHFLFVFSRDCLPAGERDRYLSRGDQLATTLGKCLRHFCKPFG